MHAHLCVPEKRVPSPRVGHIVPIILRYNLDIPIFADRHPSHRRADCSLCIRRTLEFKKECPTCRTAGDESDLRPNHALEAVVGAYKAAREELLACARVKSEARAPVASTPPPKKGAGGRANRSRRGEGAAGAAPPEEPPPAATRRSTRRSAQADAGPAGTTTKQSPKRIMSSARGEGEEGAGPSKRQSVGHRATQDTEDEEDEKEESPQSPASWRTQGEDDAVSESDWDNDDDSSEGKGRKRGARDASAADVVDLSEDINEAPTVTPGAGENQRPGTVNCPICGVGILEGLINSHIDTCLIRASEGRVGEVSAEKPLRGRDAGDQNQAPRPCTTAKLPKLVYHIMKDKALKKLLTDAGLNVTGTRAQMITRHKEFTLRVNANIDSGHEPNMVNIAREVTKLERDRIRAEKPNGLVAGTLPTTAAAETNKADTFSKLIAAVRERS